MRGAEQALSHAQGQDIGIKHDVIIPDHDVWKIRSKQGCHNRNLPPALG